MMVFDCGLVRSGIVLAGNQDGQARVLQHPGRFQQTWKTFVLPAIANQQQGEIIFVKAKTCARVRTKGNAPLGIETREIEAPINHADAIRAAIVMAQVRCNFLRDYRESPVWTRIYAALQKLNQTIVDSSVNELRPGFHRIA